MKSKKIKTTIHPENPQRGIYQISREMYRSLDSISTSSIHQASRSIADYLSCKNRVSSPSRAMMLGFAYHCRILKPAIFSELVFRCPAANRVSNRGKQDWIDFYHNTIGLGKGINQYKLESAKANELKEILQELDAEADRLGLVILTPDEINALDKMAESLQNHPFSQELLSQGQTELSFVWKDKINDLFCKCLMDHCNFETGVIIDLKTTRDPSPNGFAREIHKYGYHQTAAWFMEAYKSLTGQEPKDFFLLAVGNNEPYITEIYRLSKNTIKEGRLANQKALVKLQQYFSNFEIYPGYTDGSIQLISLPAWANNNQNALEAS